MPRGSPGPDVRHEFGSDCRRHMRAVVVRTASPALAPHSPSAFATTPAALSHVLPSGPPAPLLPDASRRQKMMIRPRQQFGVLIVGLPAALGDHLEPSRVRHQHLMPQTSHQSADPRRMTSHFQCHPALWYPLQKQLQQLLFGDCFPLPITSPLASSAHQQQVRSPRSSPIVGLLPPDSPLVPPPSQPASSSAQFYWCCLLGRRRSSGGNRQGTRVLARAPCGDFLR